MFAILALPAAVAAQELPPEAPPTVASIGIGTPVNDTITNGAPFDIWEFSAVAGEQYRAAMQASGGLAPLLGLRDSTGDVVVASNRLDDGTTLDAQPNDIATILFQIPEDGDFALIATRVDTDDGTTTGNYTLELTLIAAAPEPDDTYIDVTFRCAGAMVTTTLLVDFGDQSEVGDAYIVTAYGFDDFDPVLRVGGDDGSSGVPCETAVEPEAGTAFRFDLGDGPPVSFGETDITGMASVEILLDPASPARVTLGSRDRASGRYALRIAGIGIESAGDFDDVTVRSGPFARTELVNVWMLRDGLSRLDPMLTAPPEIATCADVGLRSCAAPLSAAGIRHLQEARDVQSTGRLDAAARLDTGSSDPVELTVSSQTGRTTGAYVLWFFGTLPEAD